MRKTTSKRQREQDLPQSTELVVDEGACMIRNVKLLGLESAWGNVYPPAVIAQSIRQYEGAPSYINHGGNEIRPVQELFATVCNVRMTESGPRGDLHYNPALPITASIVWWAKNDPKRLSMSHDAQLKGTRTKEGKFLVDEIQQVYSVDIVTRGATTSGMQESHPPGGRKQRRRTKRMYEQDPMTSPADPVSPVEPEGDEGGMDHVDHLCDALVALLKDPNIPMPEKKKKFKALSKMLLDESGGGEETTTETMEGEDKEMPDYKEEDEKTKESLRILSSSTDPNVRRVIESLDRTKVQLAAQAQGQSVAELLKTSGLPAFAITDEFKRQLESAPDQATRVRLIGDRRIIAGVRTPTSAAPDPLPMGGGNGRAKEGAGKQGAAGKTVKARSPAEVRAAMSE